MPWPVPLIRLGHVTLTLQPSYAACKYVTTDTTHIGDLRAALSGVCLSNVREVIFSPDSCVWIFNGYNLRGLPSLECPL